MKKVLIADAYKKIIKHMDINDMKTAGRMLSLVENQIVYNKKNNNISKYVIVDSDNDKSLFDD